MLVEVGADPTAAGTRTGRVNAMGARSAWMWGIHVELFDSARPGPRADEEVAPEGLTSQVVAHIAVSSWSNGRT